MNRGSGEHRTLEPENPSALLGQRIAFTGRFATLTRDMAVRLVARAAGRFVVTMSPRVTMLVVGMRGWPLMESGHVTRKLAAAERLRAAGRRIRIVSESQFREALGLDAADAGAKSLSAEQVCAALGIDPRTLERWEHCGLVRSRFGHYDFRDLVSLRTVTGLVARGVRPVVIRKSLDDLGGLLPGVDRPLAQLNILISDSGELVAELEEVLLTTSGQFEMWFDRPAKGPCVEPKSMALVPAEGRDSAGWIEAGLDHEEAGDLARAEFAYRRAAALAPGNAVAQFNLGNVLLAGGRLEAAAERFAQATALDPTHARAWFNLAHIRDALQDRSSAMTCLRRAVAADPAYADAYYNLADLAERVGDRQAAAAAWDEYLKLDPTSAWGAEARRRLRALERPAWA